MNQHERYRVLEAMASQSVESYSISQAVIGAAGCYVDLVSQDGPSEGDQNEFQLATFFALVHRVKVLLKDHYDRTGSPSPIWTMKIEATRRTILDTLQSIEFVWMHGINVSEKVDPNELRRLLAESGIPHLPFNAMAIEEEITQAVSVITPKDTRDEQLQRALELWNSGKWTWLEVAEQVDWHDLFDKHSIRRAVERFATKTQQTKQKGTAGQRPKS